MHHIIHPLSLLLAILPVRAYEVTKCYWAKGQTLPQMTGLPNSYIPCGEIDDGVQSCCRVGHNCLEAGACYAPEGPFFRHACLQRFAILIERQLEWFTLLVVRTAITPHHPARPNVESVSLFRFDPS